MDDERSLAELGRLGECRDTRLFEWARARDRHLDEGWKLLVRSAFAEWCSQQCVKHAFGRSKGSPVELDFLREHVDGMDCRRLVRFYLEGLTV